MDSGAAFGVWSTVRFETILQSILKILLQTFLWLLTTTLNKPTKQLHISLNIEKIVLFEGVKILNELRGLFKIHLLVVYYLLDLFVLSALD